MRFYLRHSRIKFVEPGASSGSIHYSQINDALCIDLTMFCREVIAGVRIWLNEVEGKEPYATNYDKFVRRRSTKAIWRMRLVQIRKPAQGGFPGWLLLAKSGVLLFSASQFMRRPDSD